MSDITSADIGNRRSLVGSRASASKRNGAYDARQNTAGYVGAAASNGLPHELSTWLGPRLTITPIYSYYRTILGVDGFLCRHAPGLFWLYAAGAPAWCAEICRRSYRETHHGDQKKAREYPRPEKTAPSSCLICHISMVSTRQRRWNANTRKWKSYYDSGRTTCSICWCCNLRNGQTSARPRLNRRDCRRLPKRSLLAPRI